MRFVYPQERDQKTYQKGICNDNDPFNIGDFLFDNDVAFKLNIDNYEGNNLVAQDIQDDIYKETCSNNRVKDSVRSLKTIEHRIVEKSNKLLIFLDPKPVGEKEGTNALTKVEIY